MVGNSDFVTKAEAVAEGFSISRNSDFMTKQEFVDNYTDPSTLISTDYQSIFDYIVACTCAVINKSSSAITITIWGSGSSMSTVVLKPYQTKVVSFNPSSWGNRETTWSANRFCYVSWRSVEVNTGHNGGDQATSYYKSCSAGTKYKLGTIRTDTTSLSVIVIES